MDAPIDPDFYNYSISDCVKERLMLPAGFIHEKLVFRLFGTTTFWTNDRDDDHRLDENIINESVNFVDQLHYSSSEREMISTITSNQSKK